MWISHRWGAYDATIVTCDEGGCINIWDSLTGELKFSVKAHEKQVKKNTLETSGEDVKNTLETSGEDVKNTLEPSGEDVKNTLETSGEDVKNTLETSGEDVKNTLGASGEDVKKLHSRRV